ncbi:hypothetical protein ACMG4J_17230 [Rossellomorea marisflavi]|uniref:hypothetical protein n=1 Tax=Rossellomorea marisflavi TaxID=189381 RepID=UPI0039BF2589
MQRLLERFFAISLLLSLVLAFIMVISQLIGLIMGNGEWAIISSEWLKQPTIILAAIFSGIAFVLGYTKAYKVKGTS